MEKDQIEFDLAEGFLKFGIGWRSLVGIGVILFGVAAIVFAVHHG